MLTLTRPTTIARIAIRWAVWLDAPWVKALLFLGVLGAAWLCGMKTAHA
ncbi:MAG: hypothetical protein JXA90_14940 [Planctomycetes bacterium]|nr:hypothetical protein [Planctomycetota bacterium]